MTPEQQQRESRIVWFEIPSKDFDRAIRFYENILQTKLKREYFGPTELAMFLYTPPAIGGAITPPEDTPVVSRDGVVIYLNADPSLDAVLARVDVAGGSIVQGRTDRLFQIVQHLRNRRLTTAAQLAGWLEASERTVYRAIRDLGLSGVPVEGEAVVAYRLRKGFDVPPIMFTFDEVEALVAGARMIQAWGGPALEASSRCT